MSLEPGQLIDGKYRIVRLIGEGGMGSVHEGVNTLISRRVAIKVLHAAAAGNEAVLKRFEREAQAAGKIGSDHILEVLDLGTLADGDRYMVMEYLEGEDLSARITRLGTIPTEQLAQLMRQTLIGLRAAHAAEIVHRDLKPDNVYILKEKAGRPDFVKIIDFGISKFSALTGDLSMTTTGAVMGTPFYMSPEQARGAASVDARTDVYAVGVMMYEALSGNVPFEGTSFNDLMFKIVLSDAPPLPDSIPADFRAIVTKAMAREADDRYQTANELLAALEDWLSSRGLLGRESSASIALSQLGALPGLAATEAVQIPQGLLHDKPTSARTNGNFAATNGDDGETPTQAERKGRLLPLVLVGALAAAGVTAALVGSGRLGLGASPQAAAGEDATPDGGTVSSAAAPAGTPSRDAALSATESASGSSPTPPLGDTPAGQKSPGSTEQTSPGSDPSGSGDSLGQGRLDGATGSPATVADDGAPGAAGKSAPGETPGAGLPTGSGTKRSTSAKTDGTTQKSTNLRSATSQTGGTRSGTTAVKSTPTTSKGASSSSKSGTKSSPRDFGY